jgi:hypothetical protein
LPAIETPASANKFYSEGDAWLAGSKAAIEAALKNGPVIL